jgi:hypothetical protein
VEARINNRKVGQPRCFRYRLDLHNMVSFESCLSNVR